jgi:hypothetical protein
LGALLALLVSGFGFRETSIMRAGKVGDGGELAVGAREFAQWRATRRRGARIPNRLWTLAVQLAGRFGLHATTEALRLDYYGLKKRASGSSPARITAATPAVMPAFVELPSPAPVHSCECLIELENAAGSKMRIHLKGPEAFDVASLGRSLWSGE